MNIHQATRSYEVWLRAQTRVVERDLRFKHAQMSTGPFRFLRATFYRWLELWPTVCARAATAPRVVSVGDLHVENFGTWRDVEGRLVWGVNDFDEVCALPYTQDLIRLATSAVLASRESHLVARPADACEAILEGYVAGLERGGRAFVLAERGRWLHAIANSEARNPVAFWKKLTASRPVSSRLVPLAALRAMMPDRSLRCVVVQRVAGLGSLGRMRFVALAEWGGAFVAREAKAYVPPAASRLMKVPASSGAQALLKQAVRARDPFYVIEGGWILRRLAPDCTRIELSDLPKRRDEHRLLRAMGMETANMHARRARAVLAHLKTARRRWLERAAVDMADAVSEDFRQW